MTKTGKGTQKLKLKLRKNDERKNVFTDRKVRQVHEELYCMYSTAKNKKLI